MEGLTDEEGMTRRIETATPEELQIEVFPEGDPAEHPASGPGAGDHNPA